MAAASLPRVLDPVFGSAQRRPPSHQRRDRRPDQDNGGGESPVGCPANPWELLKLGIDGAERTVSRLLPKRRSPPSQTWRTFLTNHVRDLVSIDFFTVPTARLRVLFVFVVLAHDRRRVLHFNVTEHPSAAWTAQQIVDAYPTIPPRPISSAIATRSTVTYSGSA
jgi:hypothetical protein